MRHTTCPLCHGTGVVEAESRYFAVNHDKKEFWSQPLRHMDIANIIKLIESGCFRYADRWMGDTIYFEADWDDRNRDLALEYKEV